MNPVMVRHWDVDLDVRMVDTRALPMGIGSDGRMVPA